MALTALLSRMATMVVIAMMWRRRGLLCTKRRFRCPAPRLITIEIRRKRVDDVPLCLGDDADLPTVDGDDTDLHQAIGTLSLAMPSSAILTGASRLMLPWSVKKITISVYW